MIGVPPCQRGQGFMGPILRTAVPLDAAEIFAELLLRIDRPSASVDSIGGEPRDCVWTGQSSRFSTEEYKVGGVP